MDTHANSKKMCPQLRANELPGVFQPKLSCLQVLSCSRLPDPVSGHLPSVLGSLASFHVQLGNIWLQPQGRVAMLQQVQGRKNVLRYRPGFSSYSEQGPQGGVREGDRPWVLEVSM